VVVRRDPHRVLARHHGERLERRLSDEHAIHPHVRPHGRPGDLDAAGPALDISLAPIHHLADLAHLLRAPGHAGEGAPVEEDVAARLLRRGEGHEVVQQVGVAGH
jgi:hypothetical protein